MFKSKLLWAIFLVALFLRVYKLDTWPVGFHADEVRVGWNAYSILKTGLDDRGNALALYYNTFGDYRPTGIFYLTIPSILVFGLGEFAVRLPSAFLGAFSVFPIYFLAAELMGGKKTSRAPLFAALFVALSPWHISVSRATSEAVISVFLALAALGFLIRGIKNANKKLLIYCLCVFLFSYLFYHSIRLLAPIFVFVVGLYFRSEVVKGKLGKLLAAVVLVLLGVTAVISFNGNSRGRFEQVSVFSDPHVAQVLSATNTASQKTFFDYKYLVYLIELVREYSKYFTAEFYIGDTVLPIRYSSPGMGLMTYSGFVLYVLGVLYLIKERRINLILALLIISPLPAALTSEDSPNLHRSLVMLPFIAMAAAVSFERILNDIRFGKYILGLLAILFMLNWHYFAVSYIYRAPLEIGFKRNVSAKELALYLNEVRSDYEEIIITNDPDDPYPWYAFYNNLDPKEFNSYAVKRGERESWQFENLIFTQMECPSGDEFPGPFEPPKDRNILVVDGFRCSAESKLKDGMQAQIVKQIHDPDGTVAYTLWGRI